MKLAYPGDLLGIFRRVSLDECVGKLAREVSNTAQLLIRRSRREAGRDRIEQALVPMPFPDELPRLQCAARGRIP